MGTKRNHLLTFLKFLFLSSQVIFTEAEYCSNGLADEEVSWVLNLQQPSGAILHGNRHPESTRINPYITNLALWNILRINTSRPTLHRVRRWMDWCLTHLNSNDRWGLSGTIYDYTLTYSGNEVSTNNADSTDSYAATLLMLAKSYLDASGDRIWIIDHKNTLRTVANVIWATYDPQLGLTYAKPDWRVAYLMDNVEVWRGLDDYGRLLGDINDPDAEHYQYRANLVRNGIYYRLWNPSRQEYQVAYANPPNPIDWRKFYPDATANLWPMILKLPDALVVHRRNPIYSQFVKYQIQNWKTLQADGFPWTSLHEVVALNENPQDATRITAEYKRNIMGKYYPGREWTWTIGESAWFGVLLQDKNCQ